MIFNVLTFDLMAPLILSMLQMGEPRRVAWSGLTTERSCEQSALLPSVRVHTDDFGLCEVQMQSQILSCLPHCV